MGNRAERQRRLGVLGQHSGKGGLVLSEIYPSIQGESTFAGLPCTFIHTTGCQRRCRWCDTRHAFTEGENWPQTTIMAAVERLALELVVVTGGEPLLQAAVLPLLVALCDAGHRVLLETGGGIDIELVDPRVVRIVDFKAPSSGEEAGNHYHNIGHLRPRDEVKLVIADRDDYLWAHELVRAHDLIGRCPVLLAPVFGELEAAELAGWILSDKFAVRLQLQRQKVIWSPHRRRV